MTALREEGSLDRFLAATAEGGYPYETRRAKVAFWPHVAPLPLPVALKAAEVCGLDIVVHNDCEVVASASVKHRGCGCRAEDKLAVVHVFTAPAALVG